MNKCEVKLKESEKQVLKTIKRADDFLRPKEILQEVSFAPRTVRYALRRLLSLRMIKKVPDLRDMRTCLYSLNE